MRILLSTIFCFFHYSIIAQNNFDSLVIELNRKVNSKEKSSQLNKLSEEFRNSNYKQALYFGNEALKVSTELKDTSQIAKSYYNISLAYFKKSDFEKTELLLKKAIRLNLLIQAENEIAKCYHALSDVLVTRQEFENALQLNNQALRTFLKLNDTIGLINSYNKIGNNNFYQEKEKESLVNFIRALKLSEQINNKSEIANCFINISNVLNTQQRFKDAIVYLNKSLTIYESENNIVYKAICYNNIAANYIELDNLSEALRYLNKSLETYKKIDDLKGQAAANLNLGIVSSKAENDDKAINYYNNALNINKSLKDEKRIALCLANLSLSYIKIKNYDAAISVCNQGLKNSETANSYSLKTIFYSSLSETYEKLGDYKKSLESYKLVKKIADSLSADDNRKQILDLEAKYQSKNKEAEINNLNKNLLLKSAEIEKRRNAQLFFILITVFGLLFGFVFYRLYKIKYHSESLLAKYNIELESKNETILKSESDLKELNATKDKFFTIISHDIKNPLSAYRSITKMLSKSFYEISEEKKFEYINSLYASSENLYDLLQNLLLWSTSQSGLMIFKSQELDISIIAHKVATIMQDAADKKKLYIDILIPDKTYAKGDVNMISIIMLNLLTNSIKYSHESATIKIASKIKSNYVVISFQDTGIGISAIDLKKLFKVDEDHKSIGNSSEKGTGIGLILCQEFITKNGGEIWAKSDLNHGSTFYISIPI